MSIIPKIWNVCKCNQIISNIAPNTNGNLTCVNMKIQRYLRYISKRYTIGRDCKKKKCRSCEQLKRSPKKDECCKPVSQDLPKKPSKPEIKDVCAPFPKKKKTKLPAVKKKAPCSAGRPSASSSCTSNVCKPTCTLAGGGRRELTVNECPRESTTVPLPKGDWKQGD